jgi:predicted metal-dependent hydrolase
MRPLSFVNNKRFYFARKPNVLTIKTPQGDYAVTVKYTRRKGSIASRCQPTIHHEHGFETTLFVPQNLSLKQFNLVFPEVESQLKTLISKTLKQSLPNCERDVESIDWLGKRWRFEWQESPVRQNIVFCEVSQSCQIDVSLRQKPKMLEQAFKDLAMQQLKPMVQHWSDKIGVSVKEIEVKRYKSRWGSCTQTGKLQFNWLLLQAPEWVVEYVVIHELCHRIEMNHSPQFWRLVERYCPYLVEAKKCLQQNSVHWLQALR